MIETAEAAPVVAEKPREEVEKFFEKILAAAQPSAVFSPPVISGAYTVITATEVFAAGGFGFGSGTAQSVASRANGHAVTPSADAGGSRGGAAGAGGSHARPVAAILIGPDGLKVQPIVDATRLALAALAAWCAVALLAVRVARANRRAKRYTT